MSELEILRSCVPLITRSRVQKRSRRDHAINDSRSRRYLSARDSRMRFTKQPIVLSRPGCQLGTCIAFFVFVQRILSPHDGRLLSQSAPQRDSARLRTLKQGKVLVPYCSLPTTYAILFQVPGSWYLIRLAPNMSNALPQ